MGLTNFQIMFEKPMPTYFSGETVNGQLFVNLSSEKKMERIKVCFSGKGKVRWTEKKRRRDSSGISTLFILNTRSKRPHSFWIFYLSLT
jgi:hypothetical protein